MTALTKSRNKDNSQLKTPYDFGTEFLATAAATYFQGGMVALDTTTGKLVPGATSTTLVAIGRRHLANLVNAVVDEKVACEEGTFLWDNSAGDPVPATQVGSDCFIEDDQTVSATNAGGNTQSRAGRVARVTSQGVYVRQGLSL